MFLDIRDKGSASLLLHNSQDGSLIATENPK